MYRYIPCFEYEIKIIIIIINDRPRLLSHIPPTNQKSVSVTYNKPDISLLTVNQSGICLLTANQSDISLLNR